jgi:hypothetical protein
MSLPFQLDDYDLDGFVSVASTFGAGQFGYAVTPNVDHLIRYHDDPKFREQCADASYAHLISQTTAPNDSIVLIGGSEKQAAGHAR